MNYEGADGIKTGFICDSGFNVVASATRDGRRLVAVVLGEVTGRERSTRAANLLEHGFQTHAWKAMFGCAEPGHAARFRRRQGRRSASATRSFPGRAARAGAGIWRGRSASGARR